MNHSELSQKSRQKCGKIKQPTNLWAAYLPLQPVLKPFSLLFTFHFFHIHLLFAASNCCICFQLRTFAFAVASTWNTFLGFWQVLLFSSSSLALPQRDLLWGMLRLRNYTFYFNHLNYYLKAFNTAKEKQGQPLRPTSCLRQQDRFYWD